MNDVTMVPMVTVHPGKINIYSQCIRHIPRKFERRSKIVMPKSNFHNNKISDQAYRKISKAFDYLVFLSSDKQLPPTAHGKSLNFKISFITLTLSSEQIHSDNEIKERLLNQFFIESKKKWNVRNYIWRAEKQKNGNIHFHILTDKFIPWSELRNVWNRIQNKLGYVDRYRDQMRVFHQGGFRVRQDLIDKWSYKEQIKAYKTGVSNDWHNPNSTDIHSIKLVTNVKSYVMKYVGKNEINGEVQGRMWGCNYELTNLKGAQIVVDWEVTEQARKAFITHKPNFYKGAYFTTVYLTPRQLAESGAKRLVDEFAAYLFDHFGYSVTGFIPGGG